MAVLKSKIPFLSKLIIYQPLLEDQISPTDKKITIINILFILNIFNLNEEVERKSLNNKKFCFYIILLFAVY